MTTLMLFLAVAAFVFLVFGCLGAIVAAIEWLYRTIHETLDAIAHFSAEGRL